jgi:hypothetical protein
MSYEPSHRRPPRQERWPNATPGEGWPAYQQHGDGEQSWASAQALAGSRNGNGYGYGDAFGGQADAFGGQADAFGGQTDAWGGRTATAEYGYRDSRGYGQAQGYYQDHYQDSSDWDGYARPGHEFEVPASYVPASYEQSYEQSYQQQDQYPAFETDTSPALVAPDTVGEWWRRPEADAGLGRGPAVGALMGILAAAVAAGVATFAAAFVRPQASPASALGTIFIDRIPATLKHSVMAHFGAHDRTVLLLGMYAALGLVAMMLGCLARRNPSVGVAGIATFGLLVAFIVITRPASRASDVIPSAVGAVAGVLALLWLARASAPVGEAQPVYSGGRPYSGGRRRTR